MAIPPCIDCGGPRTYTSTGRCGPCYRASRPVYTIERQRESQRRASAKWRARYPERVKQMGVGYLRANRIAALNAYGGACKCCGERTFEFLAFDHVAGNGNAHRKTIGTYGNSMAKWLKQQGYPPEFQILCHNCNLAKGFYGTCPHQVA